LIRLSFAADEEPVEVGEDTTTVASPLSSADAEAAGVDVVEATAVASDDTGASDDAGARLPTGPAAADPATADFLNSPCLPLEVEVLEEGAEVVAVADVGALTPPRATAVAPPAPPKPVAVCLRWPP
jgi:hypothetical protein